MEPEGETEAAYLMRRAKEFNVATRERPGDLQLWLDFAAFQDEALARYAELMQAWPRRRCSFAVCTTTVVAQAQGCAMQPAFC